MKETNKCIKCSKELNDGEFCDSCFVKVIDKRIRKYARMHNLLPAKTIIYCNGNLTEHIIKKIMQNIPCEIKKTKKIEVENKENTLFYTDWTMDDELNLLLSKIIKDNNNNNINNNKSSILKVITDKEAIKYAKISKIDFTPNKKDKLLMQFLNKFENKYKETRYSFFKAAEEIKPFLEQ